MNRNELENKGNDWLHYLQNETLKPRSKNTILQYSRALQSFNEYLEDNNIEEVTKQAVNEFIADMQEQVHSFDVDKKKSKTVNGKRLVTKLSTVKMRVRTLNALFDHIDRRDLKGAVTIEDSSEDENTNEDMLTDTDFLKILEDAKKYSNEKMILIIETLAFTGIRISELEYITVESLTGRKPTIWNKGKRRKGFIPIKLSRKLKDYCKKNEIKSGTIFRARHPYMNEEGELTTKSGRVLNENENPVYPMISQSYIRDEMRRIAGKGRMKRSKVHPHNFRHFYAEHYANMPNNNPYILPMLLGHSQTGTSNDITALYVKPKGQNLLKIADNLETHIYKELNKAKAKRDKNKRLAQNKKRRNQKRRSVKV